MAKSNGMNLQVVAGRAERVTKRDVRDKALTIIRVEGFPFSVLVWEAGGTRSAVSVKQGDYIFAEGRVQSRSYEKDGKTQYVTEIIAHRVTNLSDGKSGNVAFAVGNLGKAPSMRYTANGKAVTNVSMAANAFGAEKPEWFNLVAWERVAEVINEYVNKGDRLAVAGRLVKDTWEKDGKSFHRTKLVVNDMLMLGGRDNGNAGDDGPPPMTGEQIDEIPF